MAYNRRYNPDALPAFTEPSQVAESLAKTRISRDDGRSDARSDTRPDRSDSYASKPPPPPPASVNTGRNNYDGRRPTSPQDYRNPGNSKPNYDRYDDRRPGPSARHSNYGSYEDGRGRTGSSASPRHDYDSRQGSYGGRPPPQSQGSYSSRIPPGGGGGSERDSLWPIFKSVDKDRSGQLSEQELGAALVNGDYTAFDPHTVKMMIRMFDVDRSGTISFDEFCGLWGFLSEWRKLFDRFDVDRSGNISLDEFTDALIAFGYRLSNDYVKLLFNTFDVRQKGVLSFDLFVQACISLKRMTDVFKKYDEDRDGYITLSFEQFLTGSQSLFLFNSISPATDRGLY